MLRRHLPAVFYNRISFLGMGLALLALALIVLTYLAELFAIHPHPYAGIMTFVVLPGFMLLGLLLMIVGAVRTRNHLRHGGTAEVMPKLDLNNPRHVRAVSMFSLGVLVFIAASAFGSFQAYQATDTVDFCGKTCHKVMEPEHTAYLNSPHAKVPCVECHIGSGTTWFVRSKISGSYQVYATLFNKYPRPIETPIHNLRPAKETCEECHWPAHFYSAKLQSKTYYLSDKANTPVHLNMLMKIGGGDPAHGATAGIHAHMFIQNKISYIATDKARMVIPYVVSTDANGKETVYRSTDVQVTDADLKKGEHRTVDCIDCHNRPTHIFRHPEPSVNQAMSLGQMSATLPEIKRVSVETLEKPYKTRADAETGIRNAITGFYKETYPQVASARSADIDQAVQQVQRIYDLNYFPEMGVSWKAHPDNIGHMYADGCFRCHDGKHVSADGKVITHDCNACHTLLSEGRGAAQPQMSLNGLKFQHPGEVGDAWKDNKCTMCHGVQQAS